MVEIEVVGNGQFGDVFPNLGQQDFADLLDGGYERNKSQG